MLLQTANPPLTFTQGDAVTLSLIACDDQGNPVGLTGATFSTQIDGPNGIGPVTFGNGQHTANADQVNLTGHFTLALTTANTLACGVANNKEIVTQITISTVPQFYRGVSILNVFPSPAYP